MFLAWFGVDDLGLLLENTSEFVEGKGARHGSPLALLLETLPQSSLLWCSREAEDHPRQANRP